eukprot:CAMPEP_0181406332 /NCGR_PEP_ID=MMETSP1110-20121109/5217_1 /TAXON_ID=174948 /ORGANISM="Symbiodinium sp., Strain CCMP421" /LENGTH=150 /DNA_ID=CAMNT_0023528741 /DNA_START=389 /DNA_END=840 /DNA_ORIENTATION=+
MSASQESLQALLDWDATKSGSMPEAAVLMSAEQFWLASSSIEERLAQLGHEPTSLHTLQKANLPAAGSTTLLNARADPRCPRAVQGMAQLEVDTLIAEVFHLSVHQRFDHVNSLHHLHGQDQHHTGASEGAGTVGRSKAFMFSSAGRDTN